MNLKLIDERVRMQIKQHQLLSRGDRVLVGVSGGPDSMMLLHWLLRFKQKYELSLVAVHLNHQLRKEADQEQHYVEETCAQWGIPCVAKRVDVAHIARTEGLSIQVAARKCRYSVFEEVAKQEECHKVAVAHHADDQTETVVMRLVRGTGLDGLSGMPVKRMLTPSLALIRPLLSLSKEQIEAYCAYFKLNPQLDRSNLKDDYTRNWVRHHLIPSMKVLNPNLAQVVQEMTQLVAEDSAFLNQLAQEALQKIKPEFRPGHIRLETAELVTLPLALQRRVILLLLSYLLDSNKLHKTHIDAVLHLVQSEAGTQSVYLPGNTQVLRQYGELMISLGHTGRQPSDQSTSREDYCHVLNETGTYRWPSLPFEVTLDHQSMEADSSIKIKDKSRTRAEHDQAKGTPLFVQSACFDVDSLHLPLVVRNRRPGDKIRPAGRSGHSKIKDIFINYKVPRLSRAWWPLVADQSGPLWIPGLVRGDRARPTANTKEIITLTFTFREGFHCLKTSKRS
jgi:tRNA(Ile)-lysidine synthase